MAYIIPRFPNRNLLFHELTPNQRQQVINDSVRLQYGRLQAFPTVLPRLHPHLACLYITDGQVPQLVVCQDWQDVLHFQNLTSFDDVHPEWFAMRDWNSL